MRRTQPFSRYSPRCSMSAARVESSASRRTTGDCAMSDLQGESSNFENRTTAIVADTGWYGLNDLMLNIHAPGVLGGPAPSVTVDGLLSQGHLDGVGVIGWGGQKRGTGVVGLASVPENPPGGTPPPPSGRGKNVGVYGLAGDAD